ncbi:MAG TPA: hypothetical protein VNA04_00540 [Thermoanaerobaculia bacterium]|nr:hypothetical protein [Thermoanaerobaculia bacterium]
MVLLVCGMCAIAFGATEDPWLMSPGERLAERFSAQAMREREAAARPTVRYVHPAFSPIFGDTHPHLFFPSELVDHFLRQTDRLPSQRDRVREQYRPAIAEAGWDYERFWRAVELAGTNYVATKRVFQQQVTRGRMDPSEEARLTLDLCRARAAALYSLRGEFGEVAFNKFLYTAVAPHVRMWSNSKRDAAMLVRIEGGCQ